MKSKYRIQAWRGASTSTENWLAPSSPTPKRNEACGASRLTSSYPVVAPCSSDKIVWRAVQELKSRSPIGHRGTLLTRCVIESIRGEEAHCRVEVEGAWLPVAFNAALLRRHNLSEGMKFIWWMREDGDVMPEDIDPDLPQMPKLSSEEESTYRQLQTDFRHRLDSGEVWEEYTGDGI